MKYIPILPFVLLFTFCTDRGRVVNDRYKKGHDFALSLMGTKTYPLDAETSYLTDYLQCVDLGSSPKLCFMNAHNNSIYIYEEKSGDFVEKIAFDKEGNNGVNSIQGFYFLSEDSIYVYSYRTSILYLTNRRAVVRSKMAMYDAAESGPARIVSAPYLQTESPLKGYGGKLYCVGLGSGETHFETTENRPVVTCMDFEKKERSYLLNYPKMYADYNWGGGFGYRMPYMDMDSSSLLVSFAADHCLSRMNLGDKSFTTHYAGSSRIKHIASFPQDKALPIDEDKAYDWYRGNPSYEGIFYDKYRKLYYRIARLPLREHMKSSRWNRKPIIIVVLDADLNYLGESALPGDVVYHTTNCYVSEGGLHIQVLNDDEDHLTFHRYLPAA